LNRGKGSVLKFRQFAKHLHRAVKDSKVKPASSDGKELAKKETTGYWLKQGHRNNLEVKTGKGLPPI